MIDAIKFSIFSPSSNHSLLMTQKLPASSGVHPTVFKKLFYTSKQALQMMCFILCLGLSFLMTGCGQAHSDGGLDQDADANLSQGTEDGALPEVLALNLPGDDLEWGLFIRNAYESKRVESLPVPVYLSSFTEEEELEVIEGVALANDAVGFDVFEVVSEWDPLARVIYKVDAVNFENSDIIGTANFEHVIGYTYNRNIYLNEKYDAGRIVTDWAMEIRADSVTRIVVAHELGHAMGIQSHAKIDYANDTLVDLEKYSIMSAAIPTDPEFADYYEMMERQGQLLLEYMQPSTDS